MTLTKTPCFLALPSGNLFSLVVESARPLEKRLVMVVPPFAEEMNKSRKMMALMLECSAAIGFNAALFDLFGTGDSEGDFGDASWETWQANLTELTERLVTQGEYSAVSFIAMRTGALLLNDALHRFPADILAKITSIHYWNPVFNASQFQTQFLRLRLAADMVKQDAQKLTVKDLQAQLLEEGQLEVAGYRLTAKLFESMKKAQFMPPKALSQTQIFVQELASLGQITPALNKYLTQFDDAGFTVKATSVNDVQFWSTQEIALSETLLENTVSELSQASNYE